jgi:hypothetical protein
MVSFSFLVVCRPTYKGENKVEDFFRGVVNLQVDGCSPVSWSSFPNIYNIISIRC